MHGVRDVRRARGRRAEDETLGDAEGAVVVEGVLQLLDELPGEAGIAAADGVHAVAGSRRPHDQIGGRPQAGAGAEEVAAEAGLPRADERERVAEALAVAAVEDVALGMVDRVPVLVQHDVRVGGVRAASARPGRS